jgi:tetratricopeptide (TPR) repeat protein
MNNIYLIEDHDEALGVWRQKNLKELDLVHLDSHIDFESHQAGPIKRLFNEAGSLKELKKSLEHTLSFMHYEKDLNKQTNIANYIYPAIKEEIVRDFYWVIPGRIEEFKKSIKAIKEILKRALKQEQKKIEIKKGMIVSHALGRSIIISTLENLPVFKKGVLLDIDTDFLVIDNLLDAASTSKIGKRRPWILPQDLVKILKKKIKRPRLITISYSVNGGWTPLKYKYLGDEIAYYFSPQHFKKRLKRSLKASNYFNQFTSTGKKGYYKKAITLDSTYRAADNNYGPLYLSLGKLSLAKKEFLKILKVDPKNPGSLLGLGNCCLKRGDYKKAKKYFRSSLNSNNNKLFSETRKRALLGLAKSEFNLQNFKRAKNLLFRSRALRPLEPQSYYLLGSIFEKEKDFEHSARLYKDALRLGFYNIEVIFSLLRISLHLKEKKAMIKYVTRKYNNLKKIFLREKTLKGLCYASKEMARIEKILKKHDKS